MGPNSDWVHAALKLLIRLHDFEPQRLRALIGSDLRKLRTPRCRWKLAQVPAAGGFMAKHFFGGMLISTMLRVTAAGLPPRFAFVANSSDNTVSVYTVNASSALLSKPTGS